MAGGVGESTTPGTGGLDASRLGRWVEYLGEARKRPGDPLFPFAVLATAGTDAPPGRVAALRGDVIERWRRSSRESVEKDRARNVVITVEKGERNYVTTERPVRDEDLVVDYGRLGPEDWIVTGYRFGAGPTASGEITFGKSAERPIERVREECAATSRRYSQRLTGIIRTRTFEVTSNTLWYRFRGKADAFLAVDSHRVVNGPLHGVVRQKLKGDGEYRWQSHNVRDYIGHRVHVEFTPKGDFDLARIEFSEKPPGELFRPSSRIARLVEDRETSSLDNLALGDLAGRYLELFQRATAELAEGNLPSSPQTADTAALLNWLIGHPELLGASTRGKILAALLDEYRRTRTAIEKELPPPQRSPALLDGSGEDEHVHIRGSHKNLALERTPRRFLEAIAGKDQPHPRKGSGRLQLARTMTDASNPFISRVLVNRVWYHLFGRGIVPTVDDFGVMGEPPSHPELLDHLATELIRGDWSVKRIIRRVLLSSTYRMSSRAAAKVLVADPTNRLLHHMPIRRLPAEAIRDSILALSGRLERKMHGPSTRVHITPFMRGNRSPGGSGPVDGDGRRSIYIEVRRNHLSSFLTAFDKPVPFTVIGRRSVSNSPAQPLILMNSPFVHEQAALWARSVLAADDRKLPGRLREVYLTAFGRPPLAWEVETAAQFIGEQVKKYGGDEAEQRAWTDFCHTLINVKEFLFLN